MTAEAYGTEFRINTTTQSWQTDPSVTALSNGGFVVAWQSRNQDGSGWGVYARRYDAFGNAQGAEFRIATYALGSQENPSVTGLFDGGFVVAWQSFGRDGSDYGVYGRRYDATGTAQGAEFPINATTDGRQESPSVTALSDGGFVVTWESFLQDMSGEGVYARRYDAEGTAQDAEFPINAYTTSNQENPSVAALTDGGFVVAWESWAQDGSGDGVYARRYDANGKGLDAEFPINAYTKGNQRDPSVTALTDGGFVVAWESFFQDMSGDGVYARRYDAQGKGLGAEFLINTYTAGNQTDPSVMALSDGGFVVAWESRDQDGSGEGVYGQLFTPSGTVIRRGTDGDDTLTGGDGKDRLVGLAGRDVLEGGAGNDWLDGGAGEDTLDGGEGIDRAIYTGSDAAVSVDLSMTNDDGATIGVGGHAQGDVLRGIEHLTGSAHADRFTGDAGDNRLEGGAGADELDGGDGSDRAAYTGSDAAVKVNLATGNAGGGHAAGDTLTGIENLTGSAFADTLTGDGGDNALEGLGGNDKLIGGLGADALDGGAGSDRAVYTGSPDPVDVDLGAGTASGGFAAGDSLIGIEHLTGSAGADTLTGDGNHNRLDGLAGNDDLNGGAGNDWLTGGEGEDDLDGGDGNDRAIYRGSDAGVDVSLVANATLTGGHAQGDTLTDIEHLTGSAGADTLTGDGNHNRLDGLAGNDDLNGGAGNDWLTGGAGEDDLDGGAGDHDRAIYKGSNAAVTVNLATGTAGGGHAAGDVLTGIEVLIGSGFDDSLTGDGDDNRFDGGLGADTLDGGAGEDDLDGGDGNDRAIYRGSDAGVDVSLVANTAATGGHAQGDSLIGIEHLTGSAGADTLTGDLNHNRLDGLAGNDDLNGGDGNDWLTGGAGEDDLDGGDGNDRAAYTGSDAAVTVNLATGTAGGGHAAGDTLTGIENLIGSRFDDALTGDENDNHLVGGLGADALDGGDGNDTAIYARSNAAVIVNLSDSGAQQGGFAAGDTLANIENLTGSALGDTLTGDNNDNRLDGGAGAGADELTGGAGDDWLTGGRGADTLDGGEGSDWAIYAGSNPMRA